MPKPPVKPFPKNISNIELMNAIRKDGSTDYQRRIPEATKANIRETVDALWDGRNHGYRNEFLDALVNQVGMIIARNNNWTNPLAEFKRGMLTYGNSIEEVQTGLVPSYTYDPDRDYLERAVFGQEKPNVQASIHKVNREEYYKITINDAMLRRAFLEDQGLGSFISQLMAAPSNSDSLDEFEVMVSLFREYAHAEGFFNVQVPDIGNSTSTEANAKAFLREVRAFSQTLTFPSPYYNASGLHMHANIDDLVLFMTPRAQAAIDVEALAAAFNTQYANVLSRIITIPETSFGMEGTQAILTTKDFFVVADTLFETRSIANPAGLYNNYFLHHHQILSVSRFVPAVRFSTDAGTVIELTDPTVLSVPTPEITILDQHGDPIDTVEGVTRGEIYQVFVTALTDDETEMNIGGDVRLELGGSETSFTKLTNTGTFAVSLAEPSDELTVTAIALGDETKTATVTLPVYGDRAQLWPDPQVAAGNTPPEEDPEP